MAQIGTVRLETQNSGAVDVPVFEPGDSASGIYEFVRVETASGPGFIPVTDPVDATYPYLRVQSQNNGIVAVTDTPGSGIPDSGVARYEYEQDVTDSWNNNDATDNTTSGYVTGKVGNYAKAFRNGSESVTFPQLNIFGPSSPHTFATWIKINSDPGTDKYLMAPAAEYDIALRYNANSNQKFSYTSYDGGTSNNVSTTNSPTIGNWVLTGYTYDGAGNVRVGFNGTLESAQSVQTDYRTRSGVNELGSISDLGRSVDLDLDNSKFYNKELSGTEWADLYNTGSI